jgi:hypothetical protein
MDKDKLQTFDDEAMDHVSGGATHFAELGQALGGMADKAISAGIKNLANAFDGWSKLDKGISDALNRLAK